MTTSSRLADLAQDPAATPGLSSDEDRAMLLRFIEFVERAADDRYRLQFGDAQLVRQLSETFVFLRSRRRSEVLIRCAPVCRGDGSNQENSTVLEVCLRDHPFIVDTIRLCLDFTGLRVLSTLYLTLPATRDRAGLLTGLDEGSTKTPDSEKSSRDTAPVARTEMLARFEIAGELDSDFRPSLERAVRERLEIAAKVTSDFRRMKTCMRGIARSYKKLLGVAPKGLAPAISDARELIEWLLKDYFVLMGISFYPADGGAESKKNGQDLGHSQVPHEERLLCQEKILSMQQAGVDEWILAYKSQEESLIHRSGKIDNFLLRSYDEDGQHDGFYQLRGLFTFKAIQAPGSQIPVVRLKLGDLVDAAGLRQGSLAWKSYNNAFDSIPVEFLFEAPSREIANIVDTILYVEKSKELRSHIFVDRENRKSLYFLALPRHGYSEDLRRRIETVLIENLGATYSDSRVYFGKFDTILITFFFTAAESFLTFQRSELDERVRAVAGTWEERLLRELSEDAGPSRGQSLWDQYHRAFAEEYQLHHGASDAVVDIGHLQKFTDPNREFSLEVMVSKRDRTQRRARLRLYQRSNMYLSSILPVLDNFGLQVIDQTHSRVQPASGSELYIDSFRIAGVDREDHPLLARKETVLEALLEVLSKRVASDQLHRLTVEVGLEWRDVDLIRAYLHYLRQLGEGSTFPFMGNTLQQYPQITMSLLELYRARFDPSLELTCDERTKKAGAIEAEIQAALHSVPSSAQDDLFRLLLNLFKATIRTNRYRYDPEREHSIAFKVDSEALVMGSEPRPWREIYVYHYNMEGIHLRGGKLARGGIRWSDRLSDYRDEILGLMRTQMVKNVLIVPVGAKGGFVVRRPDANPEARRAQGEAMYRVFIQGLLDLTDNVTEDGIAPPNGIVCYDGEDPYMVVAADKGTAQFSDIANSISLERGFWLGDAFASGGEHGYDHKALAITARGAWEGVKRHFREMGVDSQTDPFTAVGIGDMAGDVFGNGMLLSRKIRLVAAFNHMHIFIDPAPDEEQSYCERERMFKLPRSTWEDYDAGLISSGGGIYSRQAKKIQLSAEAQKLLRLKSAEQTPNAVIQAILTMKVDLLWNGGIGTYIKASSEDNRDVGDLSNESVRVDASRVHARVIGEGGNLGITQAGRREFTLAGGRMNTDFVDNSGGVDCSDHEVNLKILLQSEMAQGVLNLEERNEILERQAESVCDSVLQNNNQQGRLLSLDQIRSCRDPFSFERTISALEDRGLIERDRDQLPHLETLLNRHEQGIGLSRPELAYLSAYAKMEVYRVLLEYPNEEIPGQKRARRAYFPPAISDRFENSLDSHLLGEEIALTVITNHVIDHAGAPFFFDVDRETGASFDQIVRAYQLAERLFGVDEVRERIRGLAADVHAEAEYRALLTVEDALHRSVVWLLSSDEPERIDRIEREQKGYAELLQEYERTLLDVLFKEEKLRFESVRDLHIAAGLPAELAHRVACFDYFTGGLGVADIAHRTRVGVNDVTSLYVQMGRISHIVPFIRSFDVRDFSGRWESLAVRIIRNTMLESLWSLALREVGRSDPSSGPGWVKSALRKIEADPRVTLLRGELQKLAQEELSIAALQVMAERLRRFQNS